MHRDLHGNQLACVPWRKKLFCTKYKFDPNINPHIPFQVVKEIKNDKDINIKDVFRWTQSQISSRVIVLGAPGSGKTTFIQLMADRSKFPQENIATDGISITDFKNITFWDFGGQEVLFSTHKFFLADRCQYIIVVDLSKLVHEDDNIRNDCLKYVDFWMKEIHSFTLYKHSPPVLLLGTHCDLIDTLFSSSKLKQGKEYLLQLAKSNHLNCVQKYLNFINQHEKQR